MDQDALKPSTEAEPRDMSAEKGGDGTATRPSDLLDKDRESTETVPRKPSLI